MRRRITIAAAVAIVLGTMGWGASASGSPRGDEAVAQRISAERVASAVPGREAAAGPVTTAGICCFATVKWAAWVHHKPLVTTSPAYVFIAQPTDNLAAVCWIVGESYNGNAFWWLVIDRNQGNAAGWVNEYELYPPATQTACGSS